MLDSLIPLSLCHAVVEAVHSVEELSLPLPRSTTILYGGLLGIPVAMLLHDTSSFWLPKHIQIPLLSWFGRRWNKSGKTKMRDLFMLRDAVIFVWAAALLREEAPKSLPLDFLADRLISAGARAVLTKEIQENRVGVFESVQQVLAGSIVDDSKVSVLRDEAVRRRAM
jgi:hypothetical protein